MEMTIQTSASQSPVSNLSSRFLRACHRLPVDATPVWFMRQAGRYMAEYRAIREKYGLLEIVQQPELAAEVTLQPVRAFNVDAAILFADILLPLQPMGVDFEFAKGEGPVIHHPIRTRPMWTRCARFARTRRWPTLWTPSACCGPNSVTPR
jgi:uroporphyrinogen decarboxylase